MAAAVTGVQASKEIQAQVVLYPYPSNGNLTVETNGVIEKIIITNTFGQQEVFHTTSFTSKIKGVIKAKPYTNKGIVIKRILLN